MNGTAEQSSDISYECRFSLKKDKYSDPNDGFKKLAKPTGIDFVFSGWTYRPSKSVGDLDDRLAIEDSDFNGYGFAIANNSNLVWIERRDEGTYQVLRDSKRTCIVPKNDMGGNYL